MAGDFCGLRLAARVCPVKNCLDNGSGRQYIVGQWTETENAVEDQAEGKGESSRQKSRTRKPRDPPDEQRRQPDQSVKTPTRRKKKGGSPLAENCSSSQFIGKGAKATTKLGSPKKKKVVRALRNS